MIEVNAGDILEVKTGKYDANHATKEGIYNFYTCALKPFQANTFSFDDEVLVLPGNGVNVGEVLYYEGKLEAYQRTYVLHKIKECTKYLYYYFKKYWIRQITKRQVGSATNYIKMDDILSFKIPLPPLAEQQKIAAILDAADSLRQKDQQLIDHYTTLSQSLFLDMFGDISNNDKSLKVVTIGDVVSQVKDGPHISPKYSVAGIPILSTRNIRPYELVMNEIKFVSDDMYNDLTKRFCPQKGDVLLTKGGTTGFAKIVDFDWKFCIWVHLAALRPMPEIINAKYLEAALNSHYCYQQSQLLTKGIANKDLGLKRIVTIELLLPPLSIQNKFAKLTESIESQKQQAQASLEKSNDLFNSLLQRAFKGELTS